MKKATEREFLDFFREIDERLAKEAPSEKVYIYVFGGAAAVIAYGSPRGTMDIDAYIEELAVKGRLLEWAGQGSELEKKHGLYLHKANIELMLIETPDWKARSVEILRGKLKHLKVMALGKEDLVLSKLSRYNDRDREDIQFLLSKDKVDPHKLIAYYKAARLYYAGDLRTLDTTFNIVLKEYFGLKPRTFGS